MKRRVEVVPYNSKWRDLYLKEDQLIREIFGTQMLNTYHIGSTSVPGLLAKPIIDILGVVSDIKVVDNFTDKMTSAGYESLGELGIKGRRYFRKCEYTQDEMIDLVHVHIFSLACSDEIERHLAFRDYLRTHEDEAKAYGLLKKKLSDTYPYDIESYCQEKDCFVKELEQKALQWYRE